MLDLARQKPLPALWHGKQRFPSPLLIAVCGLSLLTMSSFTAKKLDHKKASLP